MGTGLGDVVEIKDSRAAILSAPKKMASESNKVADRVKDAHIGNCKANSFRFDVDRGLQDATLADWENSSKILDHTLNYVNGQRFELARCAKTFSAALQPLEMPVGANRVHGYVASDPVKSELEAQVKTVSTS